MKDGIKRLRKCFSSLPTKKCHHISSMVSLPKCMGRSVTWRNRRNMRSNSNSEPVGGTARDGLVVKSSSRQRGQSSSPLRSFFAAIQLHQDIRVEQVVDLVQRFTSFGACLTNYEDLGNGHTVYLWNGSALSKKKFKERLAQMSNWTGRGEHRHREPLNQRSLPCCESAEPC
jgi:hypothetical protein